MGRQTMVALLALAGVTSTADSLSAQTRRIDRATLSPAVREALQTGRVHTVDSLRAAPVPAGVNSVELRRGQFLIARVGDSVIKETRRGPTSFGGQFTEETVLTLPLTVVGADMNEAELRPAVIVDAPLRYQPATGLFEGSFRIYLENPRARVAPSPLSGRIAVTLASDADSITPADVTFDHVNRPHVKVAVYAQQPVDSVRVRVNPEPPSPTADFWIPARASLAIPNVRKGIGGLGLETVEIPITVRGVTLRDSTVVTVGTDKGTLAQHRVVIDKGGSGTVRLRSGGLGLATVKLTAPGVYDAQATINFDWPVFFAIGVVLAAIVGAIAAEMNAPQREGGRLQAIVGRSLGGVIVAVVYFALGVMLLTLDVGPPIYNEISVIAVALLGGYFRIPLLSVPDRTAKQTSSRPLEASAQDPG